MLLWNIQTVADEYQWCIDLWRGRIARAEIGLFAQRERLRMAVAHQRELAMGLIDFERTQLDALEIAVRARRLDTQRLELADNELLCLMLALAAGIAALVLVVRDLLHRVPPCFAVEMLRRLGGASNDDEQERR